MTDILPTLAGCGFGVSMGIGCVFAVYLILDWMERRGRRG